MQNIAESEDGTLAGATWGQGESGYVERVLFFVDRVNPNGHLSISNTEGLTPVPVRVQFIPNENECMVTAGETPNLQSARETWGNFQPVGDFQIPLPPLVQ